MHWYGRKGCTEKCNGVWWYLKVEREYRHHPSRGRKYMLDDAASRKSDNDDALRRCGRCTDVAGIKYVGFERSYVGLVQEPSHECLFLATRPKPPPTAAHLALTMGFPSPSWRMHVYVQQKPWNTRPFLQACSWDAYRWTVRRVWVCRRLWGTNMSLSDTTAAYRRADLAHGMANSAVYVTSFRPMAAYKSIGI